MNPIKQKVLANFKHSESDLKQVEDMTWDMIIAAYKQYGVLSQDSIVEAVDISVSPNGTVPNIYEIMVYIKEGLPIKLKIEKSTNRLVGSKYSVRGGLYVVYGTNLFSMADAIAASYNLYDEALEVS